MNRWRRLWRHAWRDQTDSQRALSPEAAQRLTAQVAASEARHTGEIRVCVEAALPLTYLWPLPSGADLRPVVRQRALAWFGKLGVWDTAHNNGVLVYLLLAERAIEIVADRGLNDRVTPADWQALAATLATDLRAGRFEDGLAQAVQQIGLWLERDFPQTAGTAGPNQLPDAVLRV